MNDRDNSDRRRRFKSACWIMIAVMLGIFVTAVISPASPTRYRYGFLANSHPIDVMNSHSGKWLYYMPQFASGGVQKLAAMVRKELLPQGFTEDFSNKPWFRFVKGDREVIVCNFDEIATFHDSGLGSKVMHEKPYGSRWAVAWVHEPGRDLPAVALFQIKKLVFRW